MRTICPSSQSLPALKAGIVQCTQTGQRAFKPDNVSALGRVFITCVFERISFKALKSGSKPVESLMLSFSVKKMSEMNAQPTLSFPGVDWTADPFIFCVDIKYGGGTLQQQRENQECYDKSRFKFQTTQDATPASPVLKTCNSHVNLARMASGGKWEVSAFI